MTQKVDDPQVKVSGTVKKNNKIEKKLNKGEELVNNENIDAYLVRKEGSAKIFTTETADQSYRIFVEKMSQGAVTLHTDGTILYSNRQFSNMINVSLENIIGNDFQNFVVDNCRDKFKRLVHISQKRDIKSEINISNSKGLPIPVLLSLARLHLKDSVTLSMVVTDLTKSKITEKELQVKNQQLKAMNEELGSFAYVASHDLQEPLRTVSNYVGLFQKKYGDTLDKKSGDYLNFVTDATRRMQTLISDLLEYSRIGRHDTEVTEIDSNQLLQTVLADMSLTIKESKAKIKHEQLPVINGYPTEIKSLFQNLISNAIKFRKKDTDPVVDVTAQDKGTEWLFAVKDNGIGIDKIYFDKIFVIFQRLHPRTEYPGTGIGLAHVKKIVELHKGKIWLESEPGKGSTFYFTLPKNFTAPPSANINNAKT